MVTRDKETASDKGREREREETAAVQSTFTVSLLGKSPKANMTAYSNTEETRERLSPEIIMQFVSDSAKKPTCA